MSTRGKWIIGILGTLLAIPLVVLIVIALNGVHEREQRTKAEQDRAMIAAVQAKQHGNGTTLMVEHSTETGEEKVMELRYTIGVGDCVVELESHEDRPGMFWLDEVHTPRMGDDTEQDVTDNAKQQPNPTKQWVIDHLNKHKGYYRCI